VKPLAEPAADLNGVITPSPAAWESHGAWPAVFLRPPDGSKVVTAGPHLRTEVTQGFGTPLDCGSTSAAFGVGCLRIAKVVGAGPEEVSRPPPPHSFGAWSRRGVTKARRCRLGSSGVTAQSYWRWRRTFVTPLIEIHRSRLAAPEPSTLWWSSAAPRVIAS
jgi:hypothetical protein